MGRDLKLINHLPGEASEAGLVHRLFCEGRVEEAADLLLNLHESGHSRGIVVSPLCFLTTFGSAGRIPIWCGRLLRVVCIVVGGLSGQFLFVEDDLDTLVEQFRPWHSRCAALQFMLTQHSWVGAGLWCPLGAGGIQSPVQATK